MIDSHIVELDENVHYMYLHVICVLTIVYDVNSHDLLTLSFSFSLSRQLSRKYCTLTHKEHLLAVKNIGGGQLQILASHLKLSCCHS